MHVIGTAGHVDHGKSTLIQALTGIHPDRLREEQEREMTIDLGFAWLTLPNGESLGIVDVPGHRDFVENMLAGVGAIDAAILVIAADEGVMPQTREHLAILDLLQIPRGVVALTKVDLVQDPEWLELVSEDVLKTLEGTVLEDAPLVPVSARSGQGLETFLETLQDLLAQAEPRPDLGRPRLWVDRVFTVSGFGTVVTGTLVDGELEIGQAVELLPQRLEARVRGLQTHKQKIERAVPGSRVAINLSGVSKDDVSRGNLVTLPDQIHPTVLVDVQIDYLPSAAHPLKHNTWLKLYSGSAEVMARVRLLGAKRLQAGESGWVQFDLEEPLPLMRGDRYIVRTPSPPATVGGGIVLDSNPGRKHRRFRPAVVERLETLAEGTPVEILLQTLERRGPMTMPDLLEASHLGDEAEDAFEESLAAGEVVVLAADGDVRPGRLLAARQWWAATADRIARALSTHHQRYPLRPGMGREALRSQLRLDPRTFNGVAARAAAEELLVDEGATVRLPDHAIRFTPQQQQAVDALLARFRREPTTPPSTKESLEAVGEEILAVLLARGELEQVSPDVLFLSSTYEEMRQAVVDRIRQQGDVALAETRDMLHTSRKYAQALLEHLDEEGVTRRVGDVRVLA
jgi:selenocysteine-specific elongation factor